MTQNGTVILIDDDEHVRLSGKQSLELAGFEVNCQDTAEEALGLLNRDWPGVIICDVKMPKMDGLEFMKRAQETVPELPVVLITGHGDISMAVQAMRDGAYDFIEKPFSRDHLIEVVGRAIEKRALTLENQALRRELESRNTLGPRIVGESPPLVRMRQLIADIASADTDVLIQGETGTGKELVARSLHEGSNRRDHNFVALNCGAIPETLFESEIFGHEAGSFTTAVDQRIGKFEFAASGTVFLDEIESMPMGMQVKLLRVLQERSIERVGSNETIPLDIRVVAATKTDLKAAVSKGGFREDLYYRLNVAMIDIPPLRDRREDIPLLFQHFLLVASAQHNREMAPLNQEQTAALMAHHWPGNVRELRNVAERYAFFQEKQTVPIDDLIGGGSAIEKESHPLTDQVGNFERSLIAQELTRTQGNIKQTMEALDVPRKTLYDKMKKYGLVREDFR
ncbi:MAG: sigma-54-dependent Fis family transcriptional regulator [Rhodospirillales bacterium]|nr:sigma-54-dependent Fis family transcriptional regulator [Rhodospirillales bacterium]